MVLVLHYERLSFENLLRNFLKAPTGPPPAAASDKIKRDAGLIIA